MENNRIFMTCVSTARKAVGSTAPAKLMPTHGRPGTDAESDVGGLHAALGSCHALPCCGSNAGAGGSCSPRQAAPALLEHGRLLAPPLPAQPPMSSDFSEVRFCSAAPRSGWIVLAPGPSSQGCQLNCTTASLLPVMV